MWEYNYNAYDYLEHSGKKGSRWGYTNGRRNGNRTRSREYEEEVKYNSQTNNFGNSNSNRKSDKNRSRYNSENSGYRYGGVGYFNDSFRDRRSGTGTAFRVVTDVYNDNGQRRTKASGVIYRHYSATGREYCSSTPIRNESVARQVANRIGRGAAYLRRFFGR